MFTGNFLRKNEIAQQTVSYSFAKWSELERGGSRMEALFLKHEGYFGAMGAFLANRTNAAGTAALASLYLAAPSCSCVRVLLVGFVDVGGMPSWAASPTAAGQVSHAPSPPAVRSTSPTRQPSPDADVEATAASPPR